MYAHNKAAPQDRPSSIGEEIAEQKARVMQPLYKMPRHGRSYYDWIP